MRHGRTEWNAEHRLQGRTDIPLSAEGVEMAKRAAAECADVHFDVCYSSPLSRALRTAEIVLAGRGIPIITDGRLMEMSFGTAEGAENSFPAASGSMSDFFNRPEKYTPPEGAESFSELFARTGEFIREVIEPLLKQNKDVLIVGHGAMNLSIICQIKKLPLAEFWSAGMESCKLKRII